MPSVTLERHERLVVLSTVVGQSTGGIAPVGLDPVLGTFNAREARVPEGVVTVGISLVVVVRPEQRRVARTFRRNLQETLDRTVTTTTS